MSRPLNPGLCANPVAAQNMKQNVSSFLIGIKFSVDAKQEWLAAVNLGNMMDNPTHLVTLRSRDTAPYN